MDYIPDYSDKNFIGPRSIFASIIFFILTSFNYFMAGVYYYMIYKLYSNHVKISFIIIYLFIYILQFILVNS